MNALVNAEPDRNRLKRRLRGETGTSTAPTGFTATGTDERFNGAFSTSLSDIYNRNATLLSYGEDGGDPRFDAMTEMRKTDIWIEGYLRQYDDDTANADRDGTLGILYGGIDYAVSEDLLIGFLAQIDWSDQTIGALNTEIDGVGWMAGPYATFRLAEDVFLDVRAAWGTSSNDQNANGVTGSYDTTRWMVSSKLSGDWYHDAWRISPSASIVYAEERSDAFTNSNAIVVPEAESSIGRLTFGPEIAYRHMTSDGTLIEPHVALYGLWDFHGAESVTIAGFTETIDDLRAEIEAGVTMRRTDGIALRASLAYDGIGASNFEAISGRLWLNVPFN